MNKKVTGAIVIVAILLVGLVLGYLLLTSGTEEGAKRKEAPSQVWVDRLNSAMNSRTAYLDGKALVVTNDGEGSAMLSVSASAAAVFRIGPKMQYNPVLITDEEGDALDRYLTLTGRQRTDIDAGDPSTATIDLAKACWTSSEFIVVYSDYKNGLAGVPLASYYNMPMIYVNGSAKPVEGLIDLLGVRYAISLGDAPVLSVPTMGISYDSEIGLNEFYLWCLQSNGEASDYVVVTNPDDIYNTWGDTIPIAGISQATAQVAAFRKAQVVFARGYKEDEVGVNFEDVENYNLLGANAKVANNYSAAIKENITKAANLTSKYGGTIRFLAIVGCPIGVPFYYQYYPSSSDGTPSFIDTDFVASDYYFTDLDGDYKQDYAQGRILGRSLTDTTLLCARSLGFEEYSACPFEKGNDVSQKVYDTFSADWTENAGVFVGTSKPFPLPGALKHMKKFQYDVLRGAGMFVTGEEALKLNDVTAAEMLDKMNYMIYCGHGNNQCWYSNRADNIDARFVATQRLKPGLTAVMACQTGMTDNIQHDNLDKVSLAFIHGGLNGYIGASQLAYGLFKMGDGEQGLILDTGALYLVDRITCHFAEGTMTQGELLMTARNEIIEKNGMDDLETNVTVWEYLCYGDPAWVPVY